MNTVYVLVEAKKEYTNELQKILTPRLYEGIKSIYEDIITILNEEYKEKNVQSSSIIKAFQKNLKDIPQWNQDIIKKEYARIEKTSKCDYFEDLLEAIFITNTKILTSVQINDNNAKNIKINIPQPSHFIHKCYMECAKEIYKNPYIFDVSRGLTPKERHNNLRESLIVIDNSINNAIRDLLPIRDILKQGLTKMLNKNKHEEIEEDNTTITSKIGESNDDEEDDDENEDDDEDDEEEKTKEEEVKEQVKEELKKEVKEDVKEEDDIQSKYESIFSKEINEDIINITPEPAIISEKESIIILPELKEIVYKSDSNNNLKKLEKIEKLEKENVNNQTKESDMPNIERILLKRDVEVKPEEKKIISVPTIKKELGEKNPFIKTVNQKIFFKNKFNGGNKNNSFYKKKYEENSANYHSISDTLTDKKKKEISEISVQKEEENNNIKSQIIRNKIVLDDDDSSEDEDEIDL